MQKYIIFNKSQIKLTKNTWQYESHTKYLVTDDDNDYYYIGNNKFEKSSNIYEEIGNVYSDFKSD